MLDDYLVVLFIFGSILYFNNLSEYMIGLIIIYILFNVYKQNRTSLYDSLINTVKSDKISEYIESSDEIVVFNKYKNYDKRSFLNALKKYKKLNKYLNKSDNNPKINKNIIQNCEYYLDESINNFKSICNSIEFELQDELIEKIDNYRLIMKKKIEDKKYDFGLMYEYDSL